MILSVFVWIGVGVLQSHIFGLRRKLTRHLRDNWNNVAIVSHVIPTAERANFQLALDELRLAESSPKPVYGTRLAEAGLTAIKTSNPEPVAIEWEQFPSGPDTNVPCATTRSTCSGSARASRSAPSSATQRHQPPRRAALARADGTGDRGHEPHRRRERHGHGPRGRRPAQRLPRRGDLAGEARGRPRGRRVVRD
jgi:hypothetical protein